MFIVFYSGFLKKSVITQPDLNYASYDYNLLFSVFGL